MINTERIWENHKKYTKISNTKLSRQENRKREDEQTDMEYSFQRESCSINKLGNINLDNSKFVDIVANKFDSPNAMKAAMCVSDTFFYSEDSVVSTQEKVRSWIKNARVISDDTAEGLVMTGDIANQTPFVMKYPLHGSLIHEYFVATYGTNMLRTKIPNFAYVFGMFKCSAPVHISPVDKSKVETWCTMENGGEYLVYENIDNSVTMADYINIATASEWLNAYMQILYSVHMAYKEIDFTHYDLHAGNVVIRNPNKGKFSIKYETEEGVEYVISNRIATIIDFGYSHIKYKGKHYGKWFLQNYGVLPRGSHPLFDAYKLLMGCAYGMDKNSQMYKVAEIIHSFFNNEETLKYALEKQKDLYFYLPLIDKTENASILDLIKHIKKNIMMKFITKKPFNELGCKGSKCKSVKGYIDYMFTAKPKDAFSFYDIIQDLEEEGRDEEIDEITKTFEYEDAINDVIKKFNSVVNKILSTKIVAMVLVGQRKSVFKSKTAEYAQFVSKSVSYYDMFTELKILHDVIVYIAMMYDIEDVEDAVRNLFEKLSTEKNPAVYLQIIREDYNYFSQQILKDTKKDEKWAKWWSELEERVLIRIGV